MTRKPNFSREELKGRYDVATLTDDAWHAYAGDRTAQLVARYLAQCRACSRVVLNAGSGVHALNVDSWEEICVDLFEAPIQGHKKSVCANVEHLPFTAESFGAVVCVGEVLGYCDAAQAISEFDRVLQRDGLLICDFGSTRSLRHWCTPVYGRAADMITDVYNGSPEPIWIYDPEYVCSILESNRFRLDRVHGTHTWSSLSRRLGFQPSTAAKVEKALHHVSLPRSWADVTTIVAVRI
ncbi:MAG: hypothetical protein QOJ64_2549 [Acidobacteriota bacterium]|nr:hypothetical protein [Acidobacteriota bacterium]